MVAALSSASLEAGAIILGTAISLAVAAGAWASKRSSRTRTRWRTRDTLEGYEDERGQWHPGVIDTVQGWRDDKGQWHPGVSERLDGHEERLCELEKP